MQGARNTSQRFGLEKFYHEYPPEMRSRKKRGIRIRLDGSLFRFALDRKGLHVRRGRRRPERLVSFQSLVDIAEGQTRMNLV